MGAIAGLMLALAATAAASGPLRVLDVPYVSQDRHLCGGAAAAMVMRYWGADDVASQDFLGLVDEAAGGIATDRLVADLGRRGWRAHELTADAATARRHLEAGRPIIALIAESDAVLHYVVLVAWREALVILHDPARRAFMVREAPDLLDRWRRAGGWGLLVLPDGPSGGADDAPPELVTATPASVSDVDVLLADASARAAHGEWAVAGERLEAAAALAADDPRVWRDLAGVRFHERRYHEAARLAERALALAPDDTHACRTLAAARFLQHDDGGALAAWNRLGSPALDLVRVTGLERTRQPVVEGQLGLRRRHLLTPASWRLAGRRARALPGVARARVSLGPPRAGLADLEVRIQERAPVTFGGAAPRRSPLALAAVAGAAVVDRTLAVAVSSPAGHGEVWRLSWRWWRSRPRLAVSVESPAPRGWPGVVSVAGSWERQEYRGSVMDGGGATIQERRRRVALGWRRWLTPSLAVAASAGADRWRATGHHANGRVEMEWRGQDDRWSIGVAGGGWLSLDGGRDFSTFDADLSWTPVATRRVDLVVRLGRRSTSRAAPLGIWPAAGALGTRGVLLRGHALLADGVVSGEGIGRSLDHAGLEATWRAIDLGPAWFGLAAFADGARVDRRRGAVAEFLDVGLGLRFGGLGDRHLRLDVGHGLLDEATAVSLAWHEVSLH